MRLKTNLSFSWHHVPREHTEHFRLMLKSPGGCKLTAAQVIKVKGEGGYHLVELVSSGCPAAGGYFKKLEEAKMAAESKLKELGLIE